MVLARLQPQLWLPLAMFYLLVVSSSQAVKKSSCIDEDGNSVDWFLAYKFPKTTEASEPYNTGLAYAYITSRSVQQADEELGGRRPKAVHNFSPAGLLGEFRGLLTRYLESPVVTPISNRKRKQQQGSPQRMQINDNPYWTVSKKLIDDPASIVFRTLGATYKNQKLNSIFYSDQPPKDMATKMSGGTRAHAKGAVILDQDSESGVWLTHSVPNFPPPRNMPLKFEGNAHHNGQTFMCINFEFAGSGKQIIEHLVNMHPLVYDSQISKILHSLLPELDDLTLQGQRGRKRKANRGAGNLAQTITTPGGQQLQLYSKSSDFRHDIYSDWIDDELKSALYVASWRSGAGGKIDSYCPPNKYHVNNVDDFKLEANGEKITWSFRNDHSKWAISESEQSGVVCIADINRMESQFKRGGGAVCIRCPNCWNAFSNTILDLEPCPTGVRHRSSSKNSTSPVEEKDDHLKPSESRVIAGLVSRLRRAFL